MSLRELIDPECGGANPLMRLTNQIAHDVAHKDEGISGMPMPFAEASSRPQQSFSEMSQNQLVNEFLGQMSAPAPQSFRMDALLQEMREIDAQNYPQGIIQAPTVSAEVHNGLKWSNEFGANEANAQLESKNAPINSNNDEQVRCTHFIFTFKQFICFFFFFSHGFGIVLAKSRTSHRSISCTG